MQRMESKPNRCEKRRTSDQGQSHIDREGVRGTNRGVGDGRRENGDRRACGLFRGGNRRKPSLKWERGR